MKESSANGKEDRCGTEAERIAGRCLEPMLTYANAVKMADGARGQQQHFSLKGPQVFQRLCALYADFKAFPRVLL